MNLKYQTIKQTIVKTKQINLQIYCKTIKHNLKFEIHNNYNTFGLFVVCELIKGVGVICFEANNVRCTILCAERTILLN